MKPVPHPFPSPAGRGVFKPFSHREKGGDEGKKVTRFQIVAGHFVRCT